MRSGTSSCAASFRTRARAKSKPAIRGLLLKSDVVEQHHSLRRPLAGPVLLTRAAARSYGYLRGIRVRYTYFRESEYEKIAVLPRTITKISVPDPLFFSDGYTALGSRGNR